MRHTRVDAYENAPRDVVATGNDYATGCVLAAHVHRRGRCCTRAPAWSVR